MSDAIACFVRAMRARHLTIPAGGIVADGELHRCDVDGPHGKNDGAYVLHLDGLPAGGFENHRDGGGWQKWKADIGRPLTRAERDAHMRRVEDMRRKREAEQARRHAEAAALATVIWREAGDAAGHQYLARKGIKPHGARAIDAAKLVELGGHVALRGPLLAVPVRGPDGDMRGLQLVAGDGDKRFLPGTPKTGAYYAIGGKPGDVLAIAEGFATAASVFEATGWPVACAFDAGNLRPVAEALRAKLPSVRLVICGDNDASGTGQRAAQEAARAVAGIVALPTETGRDWNDVHAARGLDAVRAEIEAAIAAPTAATYAPASCIEIVRADAIKVEPIRWLWPGWLAAGKLHLIAGEPSAGKTTLALAFAAILSRGGAWPDGSRAPLGSTLIWSGEDDASDSIVPRYLVNGGDRARLHIVRGRIDAAGRRAPFDPGFDMPELTERARGIDGLKFIVIDPIINVAISDSHKAAETRRDLQPVVDMASAVGAAVHGVTHFAKNTSGRKTHERVLGSQAFVALARLVMAAAVPDEDGEPRRLVRCKTNIGPNGDGFEYTLSQEPVPDYPGIYGQRVTFGAALTGRAEVLLREIEKAGGETAAPARDAAADWLRSILARGPIPSSEVKARGREAGFSWETLRDAQRALGIRPCKAGMLAGWVWTLPPPKMATNAEDGHAKPMAIFATDGHLRATGTDAETF